MNAKKKATEKTNTEPQVDPQFAAKLAEAGCQTDERRTRLADTRLSQRVRESRDDLVRMCSEPRRYRATTLYHGAPGDEWHAIARALDGKATEEDFEVAAKVMAATMAALAACLVDIDEASEWLELKTQAVLAAMPILGAADRQFTEAGAADVNLPPFRGTTIVEVGAALFHPLLRACAKSATQPSSVAPEAVEVAVASMRVMLRVNRRMAEWLGYYFNAADSAVRSARSPGAVARRLTPVFTDDCSSIRIGTHVFRFTSDGQRAVMRVLRDQWKEHGDGVGLHESHLIDTAGVGEHTSRPRIDAVFKRHSAWETIIKRTAPATYALDFRGALGATDSPS